MLKCEFYNFIDDVVFLYEKNPKEQFKRVETIKLNCYNDFLQAEFIDKITIHDDNEEEDNPDKIKTIKLRSYGYGSIIYNKYKNKDIFNRLIHYLDNNYNERITYKRLNKLSHFNLRELIYDMVYCVCVNIDFDTEYKRQKQINARIYFLEYLLNSFIFFKLVDWIHANKDNSIIEDPNKIYNSTYEEILNVMVSGEYGYIDIENTDMFIIEIKSCNPIINLLVNLKKRPDSKIDTTLKEVFDYFYCFNTKLFLNFTKENLTHIEYKRKGIPLRYEKNKYNIEIGEHYLTSTDCDDFNNWVNCEDTYTSEMNTDVNKNFTPKIKCYNYGNKERGENGNLCYDIMTYFNDTNQMKLLDKLDKIEEVEFKKQIVIEKTTAETIWENRTCEEEKEEKEEEEKKKYEIYTIREGEEWREIREENHKISNFGRVLYTGGAVNDMKIIKSYFIEFPLTKERINETFKIIGIKTIADIKIKTECIIINKSFYFIDRLVAEAFVYNFLNHYHIRHLNDNYADNNADNLFMVEEWNKQQYEAIISTKKTNKKTITKDKIKTQRATEKYICDLCDKEGLKINKSRHLKTCKGVKS